MALVEGKANLAKAKKIAVITSRFNWEVCEKLEAGALKELAKYDYTSEQILQIRVPGAFEIALAAKYAIANQCDAVIALGAVIRGETTHYDYVCASVERACTELQLQTAVPVAFGVLTTENEEQAFARAGGAHGNKGAEAAAVALEMLHLKQQVYL